MTRFFIENWKKISGLLAAAAVFFTLAYLSGNQGQEDPGEAPASDTIASEANADRAGQNPADTLPPPPASIEREWLDGIIEDGTLQRDLPKPKPEPKRQKLDFPPWLAQVLKWLFIALGVVAAALFIWFLATSMIGGYSKSPSTPKARKRNNPRPAGQTVSLPFSRVALSDVEEKAAAGDFGEAIHLLLLASLQGLSKRDVLTVRPSMTAREIARNARLFGDAKEALTHIVRGVEAYLFAAKPVGESEYLACRDHHRRLFRALKTTGTHPNTGPLTAETGR